MSTATQDVRTLVIGALQWNVGTDSATIYADGLTALNVRNVIANLGGPPLSAGQVRYALGRLASEGRVARSRARWAGGMTLYCLVSPSSLLPVSDEPLGEERKQ